MAGFQQFIQGGATDRSGSAGQGDRMRAEAESRAGSITASSIERQGQVNANLVTDVASFVQTGATQYARKEYLGGETQLDIAGVEDPKLIANYEKIAKAHASGKITTDQANLAKRKLGTQVLKHNPLASPKDVSAGLFNQGDFKQTATEKAQIEQAKFVRDQTAKLLNANGYYMLPTDSELDIAYKTEAAQRMESVKQKASQYEQMFNEGMAVLPTGAVEDFAVGSAALVEQAEKQMLDILSKGKNPDTINTALDSLEASLVLQTQQRYVNLNKFSNGKDMVGAVVDAIKAKRASLSDDMLTGKLTTAKATNLTTRVTTRLERDNASAELKFHAKFPELRQAKFKLENWSDALKNNPKLSLMFQDEVLFVGRNVLASMSEGVTDYDEMPAMSINSTPTAVTASLMLGGTDKELGVQSNQTASKIVSAIKSVNEESLLNGHKSVVDFNQTNVMFKQIETGKYDFNPDVIKASSRYLQQGARTDFLPDALNSLRNNIKGKGYDVNEVFENTELTLTPQGNVELQGEYDEKVLLDINRDPMIKTLSNYTRAAKKVKLSDDQIKSYIQMTGLTGEVAEGDTIAQTTAKVAAKATASVAGMGEELTERFSKKFEDNPIGAITDLSPAVAAIKWQAGELKGLSENSKKNWLEFSEALSNELKENK